MRGPERWRSDAARQPTGAAAPGGRAKWLSYPCDCQQNTRRQVSTHWPFALPEPETNRGNDRPALPEGPGESRTSAAHTARPCALAKERKLAQRALRWLS